MSDMSNFNKVKAFMNTYGQNIKDKASFQEHKHPGMNFFTIKDKKNPIEHAKFLSSFMKRMEKDQGKQNQEKKE